MRKRVSPPPERIGYVPDVIDGAKLGSTEMVLFDLLGVSGTDEFRAISRLVK